MPKKRPQHHGGRGGREGSTGKSSATQQLTPASPNKLSQPPMNQSTSTCEAPPPASHECSSSTSSTPSTSGQSSASHVTKYENSRSKQIKKDDETLVLSNMASSASLTFKKRSGTNSQHGLIYEKLICISFLQVLLNTNRDEVQFNIANNSDNFSSFDDVVCKIVIKNNVTKFLCLQAKHLEDETKKVEIAVEDIKTTNKKINICDMFKAFKEIKNLKTNNEKSIAHFDFDKCKFEFIYFTNRIFHSDVKNHLSSIQRDADVFQHFFSIGEDKCFVIPPIIGNSSENIFHKLLLENFKNEQEEINEFLKIFKLMVGQDNNTKLEAKIKSELKSYNENVMDGEQIYNVFNDIEKRMSEWIESKGNAEVTCLTREDDYFSESINNSNFWLYRKQSKSSLTCDQKITFRTEFLSKLSNIFTENATNVCLFIKNEETAVVYKTLLFDLYNHLETEKIEESKKILNIDSAINLNVTEILLAKFKHTKSKFKYAFINLEKNSKQFIKDVVSCVEKISENIKYIIVSTEDIRSESLELEINEMNNVSFSDLTNDSKDYILEQQILFQDQKVKLKSLLGGLQHLINIEIVSKILNKIEIKIGGKIEDVVNYYVPRELTYRRDVNLKSILEEEGLKDTYVVISNDLETLEINFKFKPLQYYPKTSGENNVYFVKMRTMP